MSDLATQVVTSADGTSVEYLIAGRGPHVIVVPGALAVASDLTALARLLAARHTVHVVQRRGRGGSGPQGDRYGIARECEDIEAVRARTGARLIFGHSFGGLVALRAACGNTGFDAVAVYEPGVSADGSIPVDWIDRARREISEGADFESFITFVRGVNPEQSGRVPRWLLRIILRHAIPRAELRQNLALMPQAISEHVEVGRFDGRLADYREIAAATLIMSGKGRDTGRQAVALTRLAGTIPRSETATFRTLDHFAPEKKPGEIADAILRFFAAHARTGTQIGG
ncbi:alpha/beta hydrolase [Microbispora sp. RL4-1S]|uniref:Alpha/beta hydrolase n=1 Tax=Microbispora oryzae TaxID=2806554 RepID=A0A941ARM8_9ACTN|nr:alpha/beta hydrolase [Microbispora oryzae]MBP2706349.1 alpha/beta hydrolase [Microbispora oryzae]